jgi:hypothetical protein
MHERVCGVRSDWAGLLHQGFARGAHKSRFALIQERKSIWIAWRSLQDCPTAVMEKASPGGPSAMRLQLSRCLTVTKDRDWIHPPELNSGICSGISANLTLRTAPWEPSPQMRNRMSLCRCLARPTPPGDRLRRSRARCLTLCSSPSGRGGSGPIMNRLGDQLIAGHAAREGPLFPHVRAI